jgi:hypothetical protein
MVTDLAGGGVFGGRLGGGGLPGAADMGIMARGNAGSS